MAGAIPAAVVVPCPRSAGALHRMINISQGGPVYICAGCEWRYTFSAQAPTGSGTAAVTTASTAITVASGGASFTNGMRLFYDTGSNAEVVQVSGTPTATSIPVSGFAKAHGTGIAFGQLLLTPTYPVADRVPAPAGWGF